MNEKVKPQRLPKGKFENTIDDGKMLFSPSSIQKCIFKSNITDDNNINQ